MVLQGVFVYLAITLTIFCHASPQYDHSYSFSYQSRSSNSHAQDFNADKLFDNVHPSFLDESGRFKQTYNAPFFPNPNVAATTYSQVYSNINPRQLVTKIAEREHFLPNRNNKFFQSHFPQYTRSKNIDKIETNISAQDNLFNGKRTSDQNAQNFKANNPFLQPYSVKYFQPHDKPNHFLAHQPKMSPEPVNPFFISHFFNKANTEHPSFPPWAEASGLEALAITPTMPVISKPTTIEDFFKKSTLSTNPFFRSHFFNKTEPEHEMLSAGGVNSLIPQTSQSNPPKNPFLEFAKNPSNTPEILNGVEKIEPAKLEPQKPLVISPQSREPSNPKENKPKLNQPKSEPSSPEQQHTVPPKFNFSKPNLSQSKPPNPESPKHRPVEPKPDPYGPGSVKSQIYNSEHPEPGFSIPQHPTPKFPKLETSKQEPSKLETPKLETIKSETQKLETHKVETSNPKTTAPESPSSIRPQPEIYKPAAIKSNITEPMSPKSETPKPEPTKSDAPSIEISRSDIPKAETPKLESPKPETTKSETPESESPKPEIPKPETLISESPILDIHKPDTSKPEAFKPEIPNPMTIPEISNSETLKTGTRKLQTPKTETPKSEFPKPETPKSEAPKTASLKQGHLTPKLQKSEPPKQELAKSKQSLPETSKPAPFNPSDAEPKLPPVTQSTPEKNEPELPKEANIDDFELNNLLASILGIDYPEGNASREIQPESASPEPSTSKSKRTEPSDPYPANLGHPISKLSFLELDDTKSVVTKLKQHEAESAKRDSVEIKENHKEVADQGKVDISEIKDEQLSEEERGRILATIFTVFNLNSNDFVFPEDLPYNDKRHFIDVRSIKRAQIH